MPEGIDISQWIPFNNSKLAEEHIFEKLKKYRINNTEWFKFVMNEKKIDKYTQEIFSKYKSFMDNNELEVLELEAIEYDDKMEKYYPGYKNMSHRERKNLILPESDNEDY